jgi:hypothetical protein
MKKITLLFCLIALIISPLQAQVTVDVDPDATYVGYMVVTNLPAPDGDGAYQFEGGWGVADLVMEVTPGTDVVLKPNRIGDTAVPYWQTGNLQGNKWMNASGFVQVDESGGPGALTGQEITFQGNISAFTLNNTGLTQPFLVEAFIKRFEAGFVLVEEVRIPLTGTGNFSLTSTNTGGVIFQYGFTVTGPNINIDPSFDGGYGNLGSVVAVPFVLGTDDFVATEFNVSPNPSNTVWNVKTKDQIINTVQVFDVLGKQVMTMKPNLSDVSIDASTLPKGLYFAKMTTEFGSNSIKLIKN